MAYRDVVRWQDQAVPFAEGPVAPVELIAGALPELLGSTSEVGWVVAAAAWLVQRRQEVALMIVDLSARQLELKRLVLVTLFQNIDCPRIGCFLVISFRCDNCSVGIGSFLALCLCCLHMLSVRGLAMPRRLLIVRRLDLRPSVAWT